MHRTRFIALSLLILIALPVVSVSAQTGGRAAKSKPPALARKPESASTASASTRAISSATATLRGGANVPSSQLSSGFTPDLELGYRHAFQEGFAVEAAVGWQRLSGDASGRVSTRLAAGGTVRFEQQARVSLFEGRLRAWLLRGDYGNVQVGLNMGGYQADTSQQTEGFSRQESGGGLTWGLHGGYHYLIPVAYGGPELLLGYRWVQPSFSTTGNANLSGLQVFLGWKAAVGVW